MEVNVFFSVYRRVLWVVLSSFSGGADSPKKQSLLLYSSYFLATAVNHAAFQRRQVSVSLLCRDSTEMRNNLPSISQYSICKAVSTSKNPTNRVPAWPMSPLHPLCQGWGMFVLSAENVLHLFQNHRVDSHLL